MEIKTSNTFIFVNKVILHRNNVLSRLVQFYQEHCVSSMDIVSLAHHFEKMLICQP